MALTITNGPTAASIVSGATLALTNVDGAVGDMLVLAAAADNSGASGVASMSATVTDSAGNTWINRTLKNQTAGVVSDGTTLGIWTSLLTTALVAGTVTLSFSPNTPSRAALLYLVEGIAPDFYQVGTAVSGSGNTWSTGTIAAVPAGYALFAFIAIEQTSAVNGDPDVDGGQWSNRFSAQAIAGSNTLSQTVTSQWKVVTPTSDQSWDSSGGTVRRYALNYLILFDNPPGGDEASTFEFDPLLTPEPETSPNAITTNDRLPFLAKINPDDGHFLDAGGHDVLLDSFKGLDVSKQKQGPFALRGSIVDGVEADIDLALLSMEATLEYRSETFGGQYDGEPNSFPAQKKGDPGKEHRLHNKAIVLDKITGGVMLLRESPYYTGARATRIDALTAKLWDVGTWMANSEDANDFVSGREQTNQLWSVATTLQKIGVLVGDVGIQATAQGFAEDIFANHFENGIFPEKQVEDGIGFDGVYQTVSLELCADYYETLPAGAWKDTVRANLVAAVERWLLTVDIATGIIDDTGWTRTEETTRQPGAFPIDYDRDVIALRLHYLNWVLDDSTGVSTDLAALGHRVTLIGQSFSHDDDEDDAATLLEEKIETALFTQANGMSLSTEPPPPIAWPNVDFTPPDGSAYLQVRHFRNENVRLFIGSVEPHLRQGILQITVVTPLYFGPDPAIRIAGEIIEHFPTDYEFFHEGIKVRVQQAPDMLDAMKTDKSWNVPVSIRYECLER